MAMEKEFLAMRKIDKAFESLELDQRARVVAWASDKFAPPTITNNTQTNPAYGNGQLPQQNFNPNRSH